MQPSSLNISLRKQRGHIFTIYLLIWILVFRFTLVSPQSMEIRKTIKEELLPGFVIASLATEPEFVKIVSNATDATNKDSSFGGNLQFSILTSGNPNSQFFNVDPTTGVVSLKKIIDREQVCSFKDECYLSFEVAARSIYGIFFLLVDFVIVITDINDNPPEFTQPHRSFQLPTAFDRDTGFRNGVSEYRILNGPPLFGLKVREAGFNSSEVFLTLEKSFTIEAAAAYKVLVGAVDGGLPQLTGTLTVEIHVSDINDNFPVFEHSMYFRKIPEDTSNDQIIEQVKATDADVGPNGELRYSFSALQPPDDLSYFRIDALTGEIFLTKSIESRTGDDIDLVVEARDRGHPPKVSRTRVRILVEDTINSMPDIIIDTLGGSKGTAEVSEYAEVGKVVAYFSVRDPDSGENGETSCKLNAKEFGLVKLEDSGKYKVVLQARLDREQADRYIVTVSCSDNGFPSLLTRADLTVIVQDENDQKPVFSQRTYEATIFENNTAGVFITQVSAKDADIGKNAEIWYEIIGANKQYFDINEAGKVFAKTPLDREYSEKIVATVVATDRGTPPLSSSATVILTLKDINDMRPEFSQMIYTFEVEEQQSVGRFVGIVSASDKDIGVNQNITYHFPIPGSENSNFLIGINDGVIKTNVVLDRERQDFYEFPVIAVDKGVPSLTGTATIIIKVLDINDNDPYFLYPVPQNNTLFIPHTFDDQRTIVSILAYDKDAGRNSEIIYSVSTVNSTAIFDVNPTSGALSVTRRLTAKEVGMYTLMLMASDQGSDQERSTQTPLYIEVFFDNATLFSAVGAAGPSKEVITAAVVIGVTILVSIIVCMTVICIRRHKAKTKYNGGVPNSASTSSTTKLQGGYYVAPGVRGSSSSFNGKHGEGTDNGSAAQDQDGIRTSNPYVVFLQPRTGAEAASEIIEISRNGLNDTMNTLDLDQTDDGQFSTFRSHDDIFAPGFRKGSLNKQKLDNSLAKRSNDTFDDTSCDESTSDSGRGGSDVDVHAAAAAAAAKHDKVRAQAATPISVKSGISHRLSPLLQKERTFATFRGDSPSSFKFDSDSDTLTRHHQKSRVSPMPLISSEAYKDPVRYEPGPSSAFSNQAEQPNGGDANSELMSAVRPPLRPLNLSGIFNSANGNNYQARTSNRLPNRIIQQPMFTPPPTHPRHDSVSDHSDGGGSNPNSLTRRNHIPRLPLYPGIELTHPVFGVPNRDSISAFSNSSFTSSNSNILDPIQDHGDLQSYYNSHPRPSELDHNSLDRRISSGIGAPRDNSSFQNSVTHSSSMNNCDDLANDIHDPRPVSMDVDFLLPPYPEVDEDDEDSTNGQSGFHGFNSQGDVEKALISRTKSDSSA
ncbi:unnamed protein product [Candidula unifasciata]|uniref:Cadherin domain-containing protein n=1 Tax=Candidula unifasciata TaxID=100452 RepID=A0A8S3ZY57_9EUPU|nr:unnamed protein product [Candidula unifasciata]